MEYLIRLVQVHESFRKAEILALAVLADIKIEILEYYEYVCLSISSPLAPFRRHQDNDRNIVTILHHTARR